MFSFFKRRSIGCFLLAALYALPFSLAAQDLDQLTFTLATTGRDSEGRDFGYMVLQAQETEAVIGRPYAIYEKAADFDTPAAFRLRAVVQLQTDPNTIRSILRASERVDSNFDALETRIDSYFEDLDISELGVSSGEPDLAEKVSFAVRSAQAQPELFERLYLLGRLHPGMTCVLGLAYFGDLDETLVTWELREWNPSSGQPEQVVGRVLLDLSKADPTLHYPALPAPGKPIDVPFPPSETTYNNDPRGHLNVRLRWPTPVELREQLLLALGYSVYRISAADAIALNWVDSGDLECPAPSLLDATMLLDGGMLEQINVYPIMPEEDLTPAQSYDAADTETFFTADDDDRFEPDAVDTFEDGDEFYYFVSAQDLLRRPGQLSAGHYVMICDRQPPLPVDDVKVVNHFEASTNPAVVAAFGGDQHLEVRWRPLASDKDADLSDYNYYIYRWDSPQQMLSLSANPTAHLVGGPIPHDDVDWLSWIDRPSGANPDAPVMPGDASRTFFYTVRVEDASLCGGNLSANSAPSYGVLRDRKPLGKSTGEVITRCLQLVISEKGTEQFNRGTDSTALPVFHVEVRRTNPDIDWAEVSVDFGKKSEFDPVYLDRRHFTGDSDLLVFDFQPAQYTSQVNLNVTGGDRFGKRSDTVTEVLPGVDPSTTVGTTVKYELSHEELLTTFRTCGPHIVGDRGVPGRGIRGIDLTVTPPPGSKEYKLYRRVNNGDLSLISQGGVSDLGEFLAEFNFEDIAIPNVPSFTMCYYIQVLDEHGNAGSLVQIGDCIDFLREYPTPLLAQPELFTGTGGEPMARLTWYCPPDGVDRFEVWVGSTHAEDPQSLGSDLNVLEIAGTQRIQGDARGFHLYDTRRVSTNFGTAAPEFSVEVPLDPNLAYAVMVRAVGEGGYDQRPYGALSNLQNLAWTPGDPANGPNVAWPDRDLPEPMTGSLSDLFNGPFGMEIVREGDDDRPFPALRVGEYTLIDEELNEPIIYDKGASYGDLPPIAVVIGSASPYLMPDGDPVLQTTHRLIPREDEESSLTKSIFPFALYRYRVDAPQHRERTGHIEQVTPLMREIAYEADVVYDSGTTGGDTMTVSRVRDPYFKSKVRLPFTGVGPTHDLYMFDYSPLQYGGTYQYLIVFFTDRGEIETVLPLNPITIQ